MGYNSISHTFKSWYFCCGLYFHQNEFRVNSILYTQIDLVFPLQYGWIAQLPVSKIIYSKGNKKHLKYIEEGLDKVIIYLCLLGFLDIHVNQIQQIKITVLL